MARDLIITNTAEIEPKLVCGEQITILADSNRTGSYEVYLHDAPEGAGPPPHSHQWDEAFYASPTAQILGITSQKGAATMFSAVDHECGETPEIDKLISVLGRNGVTVAV